MITILLVDDLPENNFALEQILDNGSRKFISASTGAQALLIVSFNEIDLILLDFRLEDMHGLEVAKLLRANKATVHIPIVFVTASSVNERKKSVDFKLGTVDFLFKPMDLDEVCTKVMLFEKIILLEKKLKGNVSMETERLL